MENEMQCRLLSVLAVLFLGHALPGQVNKYGGEWEVAGVLDAHGKNPLTYSELFPLVAIGDKNGDQYPEFALLCLARGFGDSGVAMINGFDGDSLWSHGYYSTLGASYDPRWISAIHDFNGDGWRDLMVGVTAYSGVTNSGVALIHSGLDGQILWAGYGDQYGGGFAYSGTNVKDVNFDGKDDFAIMGIGPIPGDSQVQAFIRLFSGSDGSLINTFLDYTGASIAGKLGSTFPGMDVNGDGIGDFMVEPLSHDVNMVSGLDGSLIYSCQGCSLSEFNQQSFAIPTSDVNGDGTQDFIIPLNEQTPNYGGVTCRSGADGTEIWRAIGANIDTGFSQAIAGMGDFNGDGIPELLVSEPWKTVNGIQGSGLIHILDGSTGVTYRKIKPSDWFLPTHNGFGHSMDYDVESRTLVLREHVQISPTNDATLVYKFNPYLSSPIDSISSSQGSNFTLEMDFPAEAANKMYALLLSRHGFGPTSLGGKTIPLTWDGLFSRSIQGALPSFIGNHHGVLNSAGDGTIQISIAPNAVSMVIGQTITGSVISFTPGNSLDYVSVAVPISILP